MWWVSEIDLTVVAVFFESIKATSNGSANSNA